MNSAHTLGPINAPQEGIGVDVWLRDDVPADSVVQAAAV